MAKTRAIARRRNPVRRRARRRNPGFTLPMAVIGGFAPLAIMGVEAFKTGGLPTLLERTALYTTGYHYSTGTWNPGYILRGLGPIVLGVLAHKFASRLGINRALGRAGVPFIRI